MLASHERPSNGPPSPAAGGRLPDALGAAAAAAGRDRGRVGRRIAHGLAPAPVVRDAGPPSRARLRDFIARHELAGASPPMSRSMSWWSRCRCRAGSILTVTGGILFGAVLGGAAALVGATIGRDLHLPDRQERARRASRAPRAGRWRRSWREGFRADAFSYLLFLRLVPIFPFWLVNLVAGAVRRAACDLRRGDRARHHSGDLRLRVRRRRARQRDRRAGGRLQCLPRRRARRLPARLRSAMPR